MMARGQADSHGVFRIGLVDMLDEKK
jgi:hypothetical protein